MPRISVKFEPEMSLSWAPQTGAALQWSTFNHDKNVKRWYRQFEVSLQEFLCRYGVYLRIYWKKQSRTADKG